MKKLSLVLALLVSLASFARAQTPSPPHVFGSQEVLTHSEANWFAQSVDNVAALRLGAGTPGMSVLARGRVTPGDGGGGQFFWSGTSTATDDGVTVLQAVATPTGRWLLAPHGPIVSSSAPVAPFLGMEWLNIALSPIPLNIWDGTQWEALGYINTSTHAYSLPWGDLTGTPTTLSGYGIASPLPTPQGGTNCATASGTCLDNITGFSFAGLMKRTGSGAYAAAVSGTDYAPATLGSAIQKGNGSGGFSAAVPSTDYAPPTSGSAIQKGNGSGGFSAAVSGTDYAPATSGTAAQLGNGAGGFSSYAGIACASHQWLSGLSAAIASTCAQPAATDVSGLAASATTDTTNASNISGGTLAAARGGAGTTSGALKGNGSGIVSQAGCGDLSNATGACSATFTAGTPYTPTATALTAVGGAPTLTGEYNRVDNKVTFTIAISPVTSTAATGGGTTYFSLPPISQGGTRTVGVWYDSSVDTTFGTFYVNGNVYVSGWAATTSVIIISGFYFTS